MVAGDSTASARACSLLRVQGTDMIDRDDETVILEGAGLGGHMNMENFITGYPGHEHEHRKAMLNVLGPEKYKFFFDRFLDYFFTGADAEFFASLGLNCIRVPFNYRHFEDDMDPRVYKEDGFTTLDRTIQRCTKYNLYVILDLHSAPVGQNQDWHSDSGINKAFFWKFKDFQDRAIDLWFELAKRYRGNPFIAGYNPLNEPADPEHTRLVDWYTRVEKAIRAVDPDHILLLEGNTYAMDFTRFPSEPFRTAYPESSYMKLIEPFLQKKAKYALDFWGWQDSGIKHIYDPFIAALEEMVSETYRKRHYPNIWPFAQHITRAVRNCVLSEFLSDEVAELFANKIEEELEAIASSSNRRTAS
ncbi:glucan 1,3-beta-glucosidase [Seiridium cupressi]